MKSPEDIIIAPHTTEQSYSDAAEGKYTFIVDKTATKIDIKNAVEKIFQVKVINVNTMNVLGKAKRVGVHLGKTSNWKKAVVTIDKNPQPITHLEKDGKQVASNKKYKTSIEVFDVTQ